MPRLDGNVSPCPVERDRSPVDDAVSEKQPPFSSLATGSLHGDRHRWHDDRLATWLRPMGEATESGSVLADFGFTGHYFDRATGLGLPWYRGYHAGIGRWLSRDPIGLAG